jgi:hypothetical protein
MVSSLSGERSFVTAIDSLFRRALRFAASTFRPVRVGTEMVGEVGGGGGGWVVPEVHATR